MCEDGEEVPFLTSSPFFLEFCFPFPVFQLYLLFYASNGFSSPSSLRFFVVPLSSPCSFCNAALPLFFSLLPVQCPAHEVRFDSTGVILSPGYPENYPNLQMCSWLINVEKGYNITLNFELFQTEKEFDILEIFDGWFCWNFGV